jgi:hypothetical protein
MNASSLEQNHVASRTQKKNKHYRAREMDGPVEIGRMDGLY